MSKKRYFAAIISLLLIFTTVFSMTVPVYAVTVINEEVETPEVPEEPEVPELPVNEKIVEVARAQKGYYESNANKFTEWYFGYPTDTYWCTIFVSWCGAQVGASGTAIPKRSTVEGMRVWYQMRDRYYPATSDYVPCKGDIVFMNTEVDGTDNVHHVEIITEDGFFGTNKNPKIKCIGGNTSNINYEGSEYVTEKTRNVNGSRATIVGYAHPDYEKSQGIMGLIYTLIDLASPAYMKLIMSKFISLIQSIQTPDVQEPAPEVAA